MSDSFNIQAPNDLSDRIKVIKGIRGLTGYGLKDAKEISDNIMEEPSLIISEQLRHGLNTNDMLLYVGMIRNGGAELTIIYDDNPVRDGIADGIAGLAVWATTSTNYDLAHELLRVLETNCPNWKGTKDNNEHN